MFLDTDDVLFTAVILLAVDLSSKFSVEIILLNKDDCCLLYSTEASNGVRWIIN